MVVKLFHCRHLEAFIDKVSWENMLCNYNLTIISDRQFLVAFINRTRVLIVIMFIAH